MTLKVIVTESQYRKSRDVFESAAGISCIPCGEGESDVARAVRREGAKFAIVGGARYSGELYEALPPGGLIARYGVGYDGIDLALAAKKGIFCTNTPGVLDQAVAECTIGMMLLAARKLAECANDCRSGVWRPRIGFELSGRTLAVIGCGAIGSRVAKIAKQGFDMDIVGLASSQPRPGFMADRLARDWKDAVAEADFVSLHIPDRPSNRNFVDAAKLAGMRPSSWLINTARGSVVDEDALFDAVESHSIGGAVSDVFRREPYQPCMKDLRTLENVIMTPHIGSSSAEACRAIALRALENVRCCERGEYGKMDLINR